MKNAYKNISIAFHNLGMRALYKHNITTLPISGVMQLMDTLRNTPPNTNTCLGAGLTATLDYTVHQEQNKTFNVGVMRIVGLGDLKKCMCTPAYHIATTTSESDKEKIAAHCLENLSKGRCKDTLVSSTIGIAFWPQYYKQSR